MLLFYIWKVADLLSGSLEFFKETGIILWEQAEAGTSVYTVQHILGHKNVATTQIYAAMADSSKRESVDKITLKSAKIAQMKVGEVKKAHFKWKNFSE